MSAPSKYRIGKRGGTVKARKGACRCGGVGCDVACHGEAFTTPEGVS